MAEDEFLGPDQFEWSRREPSSQATSLSPALVIGANLRFQARHALDHGWTWQTDPLVHAALIEVIL
jgi:hypothetical protein